MRTYRFYFFADHIIRGRYDFQADDDDRAAETAEILFDACSDRCVSWEIWEGTRFVGRPQKLHETWPLAADLAERRQDNIVQCEEAILNSEWALASSERLLAELDKLKASKRGVSRYSLS